MIDRKIVHEVDEILDDLVGESYKTQPLAQDWARVAKLSEETGEAVSELILATAQNPRKPLDPNARDRLLRELADAAMTGVYAIQHFTKDVDVTAEYLADAQLKHHGRLTNVRDNQPK